MFLLHGEFLVPRGIPSHERLKSTLYSHWIRQAMKPWIPSVSDGMGKGKRNGKFSLLPSLLQGLDFPTPAPQKELGEWPKEL